MVQFKYMLFLSFIIILICCCEAEEDDPIKLIVNDPHNPLPIKSRNILTVFPNEIMDLFLIKMDLLTLTKVASSNKYMVNLDIIRKTFVAAITQFREDVKKFAQNNNIHTLIHGFKMILDGCQRSEKEPDLVNSLRFIFLCKFISSLKPIDNPEWQDPINTHLASAMSDHVDAMLKQGENENVKKFVLALSVYDYSAFGRYLSKQGLSPSVQKLLYGFIMLIKNSGDHMQNRLPNEVFHAYNGYRQTVNSYEAIDAFKNSDDKSKFTFNIKFKLNHKLRKGGQTIENLIDHHMLYIETMKTVLNSFIDEDYLRGCPKIFEHLIVMLFCGIQELLQFKERRNELIRKANINLALLELVGKHINFAQILAESLKKIQTEAKTVNTTLSHQLQQLDQFINKTNIKTDEDCYLELLSPRPVENSAKLTKTQLYIKEVEAAVEDAISNIFKPNGLKKYREALEIFRNMGSKISSMMEIRMNLYYAYHMAIFIPEMLEKKLNELIDLQQLHSEAFESVQPHSLKTFKNKIFNFQNLLNEFFNKFGSNLNVSANVNEKKEKRIEQKLLLKSALLFASEVYGVDFSGTGGSRYTTVRQQSTDNGAAARQQMLSIIKFFFASVSYNSDEIAKDPHIMWEYSTFSQSFTTEINTLYMQNEGEEFYFLHNQIDQKSPANNLMVYITQLHTLHEINAERSQGSEIPLPTCLLRNILYFQTKSNLKVADNSYVLLFSHPVYKMYSGKFTKMAMENGQFKEFVDTSLDWILNCFYSTEPAIDDPAAPLNLLKSIFGVIDKMSDVEEVRKMLTTDDFKIDLILRLDHVAFGCSCEYPETFENSLQSIYKSFRLKFNYEVIPRKLGNI